MIALSMLGGALATTCPQGTTGNYIIELSERASSRSDGLQTFISTKLGRRSGDTVRNTVPLINAIVASLSAETLAELNSDDDVSHVNPDCVIELDPDESVTSLDSQADATWGIDRIDSRTGTDGTYNYDGTGSWTAGFS